ncbi:hypothetical protein BGW36DRAFT_430170 [Talaromyces proteolyticus]|uniref:Uncharacterized protein n=1 Tax=Talaromyces proteolyticus TaxID=1131652 RepID=A0AAD4KM32_9EURO|nr:uncharacterized protein BGW36DRAFT_430170 [Talaromyces proteolyticus]KAH8694146.1 hypothetical protein BGW36DRAFT_430170 [Talaromyces proteolyticus]
MACLSNNVPYSIWRLRVFSDIFLPRKQIQITAQTRRRHFSSRELRNHAENCDRNSNSSLDKQKTSPDAESVHIDGEAKNGASLNKSPPLSASLPQSPLIELAQTRQSGNKKRKPRATKADHGRLANNPWAVALASPIRSCSLTLARLPTTFLTEMGLVRRVTESDDASKRQNYGSLWWLPTGLLKEEIKATSHTEQGNLNDLLSKGKPRVVRMISRALLLQQIPQMLGYEKNRVNTKVILPSQWHIDNPRLQRIDLRDLIWRQDMASFVLKHMGKAVVKGLKEVCRYEKIKKDDADIWREIPVSDLSVSALVQALKQVEMSDMETGAVVVMGDPSAAPQSSPIDVLESASKSAFPDYLTLPQTGSMVPVYDLTVLLSRPDLDALRACHPRFSQTALFFRPDGPKSVTAMIDMWKIKSYVMHDVELIAKSESFPSKPTSKESTAEVSSVERLSGGKHL